MNEAVTVRVQKVKKNTIKSRLVFFLILVALLLLVTLFSNQLAPYDPYAQDVDLVADGPSVWPTCVSGGAELHLAPQACTIYTILGTVVAHYPQALETRTIAAPSQAGVYVVVFDNKKSSRILVR